MNSWLKHLRTAIALNNGFVLITIIATKGSTPCSHGDKIVYTDNEAIFGSIGVGILNIKHYLLPKKCLILKITVTSLLSTLWVQL